MNPTYLSQIDISNFRSFGPNFSLDIPAKPGLVIIYGMNGLGKTTFFEAIEWLLTGDVRRISDPLRAGQLENYLTRHDADDRSHQVTIKFGDEEKRFARTTSAGPTNDELADFLTNPSWNLKPSDTSPYFRLTMFLPQSKRFRFEEEKPAKQWKLLEGPAGVERVRQMLQALGSGKTKNAFDRVVRDLERGLEKQQTQLKEWQDLLRRRDELKSQVSITRVIEPSAADESLSKVLESLVKLTDVTRQVDEQSSRELGTTQRISATVRITDEALEQRREQLQKLKDSSETVSEWDTLTAQVKSLITKIQNEEEQLEAGKPEMDALIADKDRLVSLREDAESEQSKLAKQIASARRQALAANAITLANEKLGTLNKERDETNQRLEKSKLELKAIGESIIHRTTIAAEIESLNEKLIELRKLQAKCAEHQASSSQSDLNDAELRSLQAEQTNVESQKTEAESLIAELVRREEKVREEKRLAVASAETVHKALATMCDHIAQDATTCPICRAEYESGRLHTLAQKSFAEAGVDTVGLDESLSQIKKETSELQLSADELAKRGSELPDLIAQLAKLKAGREELWKEVETLAMRQALPNHDVATSVKGAIDAADKTHADLLSQLQSLPASEQLMSSNSSLRAKVTSDEARTREIASEITEQQNLKAENQSIVDTDDDHLASSKSPNQSWGTFTNQLVDQQNALASRISALDVELSSATDATKVKEKSQTSIQHLVDQARRELTAAESRQMVLSERWERIVGEGIPDSQSLGRLVASTEEEIERLESSRRKCEQLGTGVDAWNADTQSREIASKIGAECEKRNNCAEDTVSTSLATSIEEGESKVTAAKGAFAKAKEMAEELKEKADAFNDRALKPLTNRIQRFHDVLSPFRYQIEWAAKTAAGGGTKLTQSVSWSGGGSHHEAPPLAELSDGQISVQGLATLFAASTEYRWSRWPALLLDDPLQSSDILHASAFIDIIRGLITDMGYQIFLSSHDMEEAKYIIRKCERSDISVTQCHLLGPGVNGVRWTTE